MCNCSNVAVFLYEGTFMIALHGLELLEVRDPRCGGSMHVYVVGWVDNVLYLILSWFSHQLPNVAFLEFWSMFTVMIGNLL